MLTCTLAPGFRRESFHQQVNGDPVNDGRVITCSVNSDTGMHDVEKVTNLFVVNNY